MLSLYDEAKLEISPNSKAKTKYTTINTADMGWGWCTVGRCSQATSSLVTNIGYQQSTYHTATCSVRFYNVLLLYAVL